MKTLFEQYRPFFLFLGKFFFAYLILTLLYSLYLGCFQNDVDGFTTNVTGLTKQLLELLGNNIEVIKDVPDQQFQFYFNGTYLVRIIEGCNAVSVIVLFAAFIVAFSNRWKPTLLFVVFGSVLIYYLNVFRIALLIVLLDRFPQYSHFFHGVVFPLMIYGIVFLLWIYWVRNYSKYALK